MKQLLISAGISRHDLAHLLGITVKATYSKTPKSTLIILNLLAKLKRYEEYEKAHRGVFG